MIASAPRSVTQFCRDVEAVAERGDRSEALGMILDLVHFTIASQASITRVLSSRELDATCLRLGRTPLTVDRFDPEHSVFLVTYLSRSGGHTRVLRDLIAADPARRSTILVSNVTHDANVEELRQALGGAGADVHVAPSRMPLGEVVTWLQEWLVKLGAERAYILQHHFDPAIPAAVQPGLVDRLFYIHNCDHSLALGVHIPHATHVDLHGKGFHNCRDREGVAGNVRWPLIVAPKRTRGDQFGDAVRRTCTSGGREKFGSTHLLEQIPYLIGYPDMVATILGTTGGTHHHIGELPQEMLDSIARRLEASGIDPSRFVHISFVPHLSDYLVEHEIDLYVGSMPWGGGRALIEIMATGLPITLHSNYQSVMLTDQNEVYPGAPIWRNLEELAEHIARFDQAALQSHARSSLAFYEARHRPEALEAAMGRTLRHEPGEEPARPVHHPDALQTFLDERAMLGGQVRLNLAEIQARDGHVRELEQAFKVAQTFALERLAEMERLDKQLLLTDQALATVTQLAYERQAEIEALRAQMQRMAV